MVRRLASVLALVAAIGCTGPAFTNLGNGVGVPSESIDQYAKTHGITREEARARMRTESDAERAQELAAKHGTPVDEAKRQRQQTDSPGSGK
ncbi:MAG: hypothetical protein ACYC35_22680 [Pirellulales bacterium]